MKKLTLGELESAINHIYRAANTRYTEEEKINIIENIHNLHERIIELTKSDKVWRNQYAIVQNDLATAWEVIEKQHNKLKEQTHV